MKLLPYLSAVLVAVSIPVDGLPGAVLAAAGVAAAVVFLRHNRRGGAR